MSTATNRAALQRYHAMYSDHWATVVALDRLLSTAYEIILSASLCRVCKGKGLHRAPDGVRKCALCQGLGFVTVTRRIEEVICEH